MLFRLWLRLVQFGFYLLYNPLAWTYDTVSALVSLGQWQSWGRAALNHLKAEPGARVLELAHGPGHLQAALQRAGYQVIGCDLSAAMGRIAQARLKQADLPQRLIRSKAQRLPFCDGAFAALVSTFPTNFILEADTLREAQRVLRRGGRLVIIPSASLTGRSPVVAFIEWLYRITGQREKGALDEIHALFARGGFELQIVEEKLGHSTVWVMIAIRMA